MEIATEPTELPGAAIATPVTNGIIFFSGLFLTAVIAVILLVAAYRVVKRSGLTKEQRAKFSVMPRWVRVTLGIGMSLLCCDVAIWWMTAWFFQPGSIVS